jgi:hypothetical protein
MGSGGSVHVMHNCNVLPSIGAKDTKLANQSQSFKSSLSNSLFANQNGVRSNSAGCENHRLRVSDLRISSPHLDCKPVWLWTKQPMHPRMMPLDLYSDRP